MALKSTVFKAQLQIADMDRGLYADHALTVARHPSENDERLMVRLLAFALNVPADDHHGRLEFSRGLSDADEPALWQHDLTGVLLHWIDVGQPDERRMLKAAGRAQRVTVMAFSATVNLWWAPLASKLTRAPHVTVWALPSEQTQALAALAERTMQLQITVQDGQVWVGNGTQSIEVAPRRLTPG